MQPALFGTVDANEAVASVAFRLSETIAIYPITPSSPMAESCDEWAAQSKQNLWSQVPRVVQMQSEAGAAGAIHGMLIAGSLTTTFTASQGLLLMIPELYKIAGELTPFVLHVTARTLATHALSIFGDHSDVMACRQTGVAMLASNSVQEAQDFAALAHAATLRARVPFLHFFDGFRTSHEINKIRLLGDETLRELVDPVALEAFRYRGLTPDQPTVRGTAQNPDVFFQAREACQPFYDALPAVLESCMEKFADLTGRRYGLCEYTGHPRADRVIVAMGSGAETAEEASEMLNARGEKTGVLKVRLYRPFPIARFLSALPSTVRSIAVLDRTKEPGAVGEPLYCDVVAALAEGRALGISALEVEPVVIGGRYGLSSKEFTPGMAAAAFAELEAESPKRRFTLGIHDDLNGSSLPWDPGFLPATRGETQAVFYGLGSDGTVGANKNSIKIIGEDTDLYAQGYFVYDSKKAGATTVSHLRFGPERIREHYLIRGAQFVACHHFHLLKQMDVLDCAAPGAVFLLNAAMPPDNVWDALPAEAQSHIRAKRIRVYAVDASAVAREAGLGSRINTVMQTCFFALSGVLPRDEAIACIKKAIEKTYGKKGESVVRQNFAAVDSSLAGLHEISPPEECGSPLPMPQPVAGERPYSARRDTGAMLAGKGDDLPVTAFPADGTWPVGTAQWEKRNLAEFIPQWDPALCIQCNKCVFVCPHAAIRAKYYAPSHLDRKPGTFLSAPFKSAEFPGKAYTIQVAPEDCTGCTLCVTVCPAKDKANPRHKALDMIPQAPAVEAERENYRFFLDLPDPPRAHAKPEVKSSQFLEPLFEYSGACAGCGETPYIKLLTQLFGDRALIANATGCSSIYGGNLPTTPYTTDRDGRGPAWANSLFEDNAEFGFGIRFALDHKTAFARSLLAGLAPKIGDDLVSQILTADQSNEAGIAAQRERVHELRIALAAIPDREARDLSVLADALVKKSVWVVGGDGWAYDIGFGGLDHVLSLGLDLNILVLDTGVYSNTGGQSSKATPLGAVAKFAAAGKDRPKKDLGLMAMSYGNCYVASVAFGSKDGQTVKAFTEAESFPGTSIIVAYSHCIAHGYAMHLGLDQQKLAVDAGAWMLYRYDPRRAEAGLPPLQLDSTRPKHRLSRYVENELRFRMLERSDPGRFRALVERADADAARKFELYSRMAADAAAAAAEIRPA